MSGSFFSSQTLRTEEQDFKMEDFKMQGPFQLDFSHHIHKDLYNNEFPLCVVRFYML